MSYYSNEDTCGAGGLCGKHLASLVDLESCEADAAPGIYKLEGSKLFVAGVGDAAWSDGSTEIELPSADGLSDYDGVVWTGSSLTIHDEGDPRVTVQVDFAREVYRKGTPSFGSCWAAQLAVRAAGGRCAASPRGREFGISRSIELSAEGRLHPLFAGKPRVFDAFTSHADHIAKLPARGSVLASNGFSPVQAVAVEHAPSATPFWAVQYHPEYDLHEVASLCRLRADELVAQGVFRDGPAVKRTAEAYESLQRDPTQKDIAFEFDVPAGLLDAEQRTLEVRNWLVCQIARQSAV